MRVGFAGTPEFAAEALAAVIRAGFQVVLVLSQPDRPKGRGLALTASPVKRFAQEQGIAVATPPSLKDAPALGAVLSVPLDVLVVAAYGLIFPPAVLTWPKHGCLNIHASLLPRWRGAAPIQRALLAGDGETGITIMRMDEGLDTGPIVTRAPVAIDPRETAGSLHAKLAAAGALAIIDTLQRLAQQGELASVPQPSTGACYAPKIERAEAAIDWTLCAPAIDRVIRAFDPVPGAFTALRGTTWKIWRAEPTAQSYEAPPGTIVSDAGPLVVACGSGSLAVQELQAGGGKRLSAAALVAGRRIRIGDRFMAEPSPVAN